MSHASSTGPLGREEASGEGVTGPVEPIPHAVPEGAGDEPECSHVVEHIYEYLDSEMTEQDAARMRAHLAHCSPCLAELGVDEIVRQMLRRSCADKAPATLRARIRAQLLVTPDGAVAAAEVASTVSVERR